MNPIYIDVITCLSQHNSGMTQAQILKSLKILSGGRFTKILNELESCGFIMAVSNFEAKKKERKYRLIDEYCLFYLKWIKPIREKMLNNIPKDYWQAQQNSPAFYAWSDYAFEGLCLKHVDNICKALGIQVVILSASSWLFLGNEDTNGRGAQVNLVLDRRDRCINLCEIKFSNSEYIVTKEYAKELNWKKEAFRYNTKTKKSLFTTLITTFGAANNTHCLSSVDKQLTMDALFDESNY